MLASRLLRHEWRGLTADALVWILIVTFALGAGYGLINGIRWVAFQKSTIADAAREERDSYAAFEADIRRINGEQLTVAAFADPRNADAAGRRMASRCAVMPPADLAPLAIGQTDLLPYYFRITTDAKESVLAATELENPQRLLAGCFDLAFVIIYLFPLLILALSYNLLSAEKERGTLALALSQPTSLRALVLKIAPRLLLFLGLAFACAVAAALLASLLTGLSLMSGAVLAKLLAWIAIVSLYGLFWFVLAVAVAALDKSSAGNAVILAGAWVLIVMLVPSAVIEEYARQLAGQQRLVNRLRFLSPAVLLLDGLNDLAGAARHRHFVAQVEAYHAAWRAYFQPRVLRRQPLADYAGVPRFAYREEPLRAVLARTSVAAAGLAAPIALLAVAGLRRGSRIEIR
jgi:ABC-2 type transport system permease protein